MGYFETQMADVIRLAIKSGRLRIKKDETREDAMPTPCYRDGCKNDATRYVQAELLCTEHAYEKRHISVAPSIATAMRYGAETKDVPSSVGAAGQAVGEKDNGGRPEIEGYEATKEGTGVGEKSKDVRPEHEGYVQTKEGQEPQPDEESDAEEAKPRGRRKK